MAETCGGHSFVNRVKMKKLISLLTKIFPRQFLIRCSYLFSFLIRPFYWGNKVECPVCGKHFRKFLPYGYGEAVDNRMCPNCLSLERHRLLWLFLKEKTEADSEMLRVLPCFQTCSVSV